MKSERDALKAKYGKEYCDDNGWAASIFGGRSPRFYQLEEKAQLAHRRGYYKWASHEVHADSKGWRLNKVDLEDGGFFMSTGYAGAGLADPADLALISLVNTTISLLFSDGTPEPETLLAASAITALQSEAADELLRCHDVAEVEDAEFHAAVNRNRASE